MTWASPSQEVMEIIEDRASRVASRYAGSGWSVDDLVAEGLVYYQDKYREGMLLDFFAAGLFFYLKHRVDRDDLYGVGTTDAEDSRAWARKSGRAPSRVLPGYVHSNSYTEDEVRYLLPGVWDHNVSLGGSYKEQSRDPEMPGGQGPNPAHGNTLVAKVADIQRAFDMARLTRMQQSVLLLRYGCEMLYDEIGKKLGITGQTAGYHDRKAIAAIMAILNG